MRNSAVVLQNVVVDQSLCQRNLLGHLQDLGQRVVWQIMHLHSVVWHELIISRALQTEKTRRSFTFGNDEGMSFGQRSNVKESEAVEIQNVL